MTVHAHLVGHIVRLLQGRTKGKSLSDLSVLQVPQSSIGYLLHVGGH